MNLSRKILLAACASVAFLVVAPACMVDEPDIEAKGKFVCKATPGCLDATNACLPKTGEETKCKACSISDSDTCLGGNVCVVVAPQLTEGRCVRNEDVDHCNDYDKDGYMAATPGYEDMCGFSEKFPMDCDDSDPNVYPGPNATEYCDGKDNTCDGCVDGTCPAGKDCIADASACKPLVELCFGIGTMEDVKDSVCSAKNAGVRLCNNGKFVYAKEDKISGELVVQTTDDEKPTSCPTAESIEYVDSEFTYNRDPKTYQGLCGTGKDHDCNGIKGDGCEKCDDKTNDLCFVSGAKLLTSSSGGPTGPINVKAFYQHIYNTCKPAGMPDPLEGLGIPVGELEDWIAKCSCVGKMKCLSDEGSPVCFNNGTEVTAETTCAAIP